MEEVVDMQELMDIARDAEPETRARLFEVMKWTPCFVSGCEAPAEYEAWVDRYDFAGIRTGYMFRATICSEHKTHPHLCANRKEE